MYNRRFYIVKYIVIGNKMFRVDIRKYIDSSLPIKSDSVRNVKIQWRSNQIFWNFKIFSNFSLIIYYCNFCEFYLPTTNTALMTRRHKGSCQRWAWSYQSYDVGGLEYWRRGSLCNCPDPTVVARAFVL